MPGTTPRMLGFLAIIALLGCHWAVAAEGADDNALLQAQLAAGEFAPAMAAANAADDPARRDRWLGEIAAAQAAGGDRGAALRTAESIADDRSRSESLSQVVAQPWGGRGGANQADFESLIELITSTVSPLSWVDAGGAGSIEEFPTGVYVDPDGVLRRVEQRDATGTLDALRTAAARGTGQDDVRRTSPLRKVSLPRLEKHAQLRWAAGQPPTDAMRHLAGLQRIQYVFVYPDTGDLVLAGPAGDWTADAENRAVSTETGQPVLRLDDLVVVFRHVHHAKHAQFGCAITPTQEALARTQAFLGRPAGNRTGKPYLEQLRAQLGRQEIDVNGLDPRTRAARVMVEADYHMKRIGMGLEEGVPGVVSYLDLIRVGPGQSPPPMGVLRWWFTLDYDALLAAENRQAFGLRGQGVKVLSENELLTAQGRRVHTNKSEQLNRQFAESFTKQFAALSGKYPVYAELRNLCDLALVAALVRQEGLADQVGWHQTFFGDPEAYAVELGTAPKSVETIANLRRIRSGTKLHTIYGVSGGVEIRPNALVTADAIETDRYGALATPQSSAAPNDQPAEAWWWD